LFAIVLAATAAAGETHPSWWAYASPEATALVGIQWNNLRGSPFAAAIEAQIAPGGALGFPDLDCLRKAREIFISSPALLAAETGDFPVLTVQEQAQRQGFSPLVYRGAVLWLPEQADKLGVAQVNEHLVLVGARKTLERALDGQLSERGRADSALLTQAARFSETADLWVAAVKLPDPLATRFVPLDAAGSGFLGRVTVHDGLTVQAFFDAGSEQAASGFVRAFRDKAPSFPLAARRIEAAADQSRVTIALQVSSSEILTAPYAAPQPAAVAEIANAPQGSAGLLILDGPPIAAEPEPPPAPYRFEVTHVEASQPRIIRIFNLEEGTREVNLPLAH
jgi:hypothetical protein